MGAAQNKNRSQQSLQFCVSRAISSAILAPQSQQSQSCTLLARGRRKNNARGIKALRQGRVHAASAICFGKVVLAISSSGNVTLGTKRATGRALKRAGSP